MHATGTGPNREMSQQNMMQSLLEGNEGYYVIMEFLIGTSEIVRKDGILYSVGVNYVVLYQPDENRYVVCDLYAIKFVYFYDSKVRPKELG